MLDESFYNLTSVALHDHENYVRMRTLAEFRYGLKISSSHLPYMSVSQGLDLLEIIRDLQTFVAGYNYDVSEQVQINDCK